MSKTKFFKATSVAEAIGYLNQYRGQAKLLAGGTDIMVLMNQYEIPEETVFVGIEDIDELKQISLQEDGIHIGSAVTDTELIESDIVRSGAWALFIAASESASTQVRNRATIGGNVGTASPSGDVQAALIALNALAVVENEKGTRTIPVESIPVFVKKTSLGETDIIREFIVPSEKKTEGSCFVKMGKRKAMTISIVDVAAKITLTENKKKILAASVVAGACAPTVVHLKTYEEALKDIAVEEEIVGQLVAFAKEDVSPITDVRGSAWYRTEVIQTFAKRAVWGAIENACMKEGGIEDEKVWTGNR